MKICHPSNIAAFVKAIRLVMRRHDGARPEELKRLMYSVIDEFGSYDDEEKDFLISVARGER